MTIERFPRPVVCAWCANRYRAIAQCENSQGDDCASSVFQVTDAALWRFVQNPPTTATAGSICDNCVNERRYAGDLEKIEGQYPW